MKDLAAAEPVAMPPLVLLLDVLAAPVETALEGCGHRDGQLHFGGGCRKGEFEPSMTDSGQAFASAGSVEKGLGADCKLARRSIYLHIQPYFAACQWGHRILRGRCPRTCAWVAACFILASCAQLQPTPSPEQRTGAPSHEPSAPRAAVPTPETPTGWRQRGRISHYGNAFAGKPTASGDTFDPEGLTMAHRTLPFGTLVRVTNLENQQSVEVVVNDRGPFVPGRIADLSSAAAQRIGMMVDGVVDAVLEVLQPSKVR